MSDSSSALLIGGGVLALLLVILRLLQRNPTLRSMSFTYLIGSFALAVLLAAPALPPLLSLVDHILITALVIGWGYVGLVVVEYTLVGYLSRRQQVQIPRLARDLVRVVAFILGMLVTLQLVFNIPPNSIVISSTVLSAVIGLALQDVLKNIFAGVSLQIERPYEVGHWIQLNDMMGKVTEINWRETRIVNIDGQLLIYPNANVAAARITNFSLPSNIQAMHVLITVNANHPPNYVRQILREAIAASPYVVSQPAAVVRVQAYEDYRIIYDLKFCIDSYDNFPEKRDSVMINAWYALQRAGIKLATPTREVYHYEQSRETLSEQEHLQQMLVAQDLRKAPVLQALDDDEIFQLARRVHMRIYGVGDLLVRQGERGDTLFILRSGSVRVDVQSDQHDTITVATLGPGECFGEMALMTGDPRGATVIAERDTEVLVVAKENIAPLFVDNPTLPERLGAILLERRQANQAALSSQRVVGGEDENEERRSLIAQIRSFFGLGRN
jgi:small-conductance mechanosensitive channel/CRP-like cAMP-binding protein